MGSVSTAVLAHASGSVRIARRLPRINPGPAKVVLGVDGSSGADAATRAVMERHWPVGVKIKVVSAAATSISLAVPASAAIILRDIRDGTARHWAEEAAERAAAELRSVGLDAAPVVQEGNPRKILLEEAVRWQADCIFVGAKGLSRLERFLLGSVSYAVAVRAPCSVEVVRDAASSSST
jgi:nucleotide-binding universal stress UspA family protein